MKKELKKHCIKHVRVWVSLTRIIAYNGQTEDSVIIRENIGHRMTELWRILRSENFATRVPRYLTCAHVSIKSVIKT